MEELHSAREKIMARRPECPGYPDATADIPAHKPTADKSRIHSDEGWRRERRYQAGRRSYSSIHTRRAKQQSAQEKKAEMGGDRAMWVYLVAI